MLSKFIILAIASFVLSAAAAPDHGEQKYTCNTGSAQCCDSVHQVQSSDLTEALTIVGISAQGLTGLVGFNCSPFTGVGTGSGSKCHSGPLCCDEHRKNKFGDAIYAGCSPINVTA